MMELDYDIYDTLTDIREKRKPKEKVMPVIKGTVEKIYVNDRNVKGSIKQAMNFKINGDNYSGGFKKWVVNEGDEVEVTYEVNAKGYNNITKMDIVGTGGLVSGHAPRAAPTPRGGRSFPVEPLAPERTINRQNALTAAVATYVGLYGPMEAGSEADYDVVTSEVVGIARAYEAYTTGDTDREEALRRLKEESEGEGKS